MTILSCISGTGLYTPPNAISNDELVTAFNSYVSDYNKENASQIEAGEMVALEPSSTAFIEKASGIKSRFVIDKEGVLDPKRMAPNIAERPNDQISVLAEMGVKAAREAMEQAGKTADEIDAVIVACSNLQRAYPAIAIEVQMALGIDGYAYDMNVACSSATFGIQNAVGLVNTGQARAVLVVNPEICSGHLNFRDRDSHFIFGDVATAVIVEAVDSANGQTPFEIVDTKLKTQFSNNIRNNFGFLNRCAPEGIGATDKLFVQQGRRVFKEVVPMVSELISTHIAANEIKPDQLKRLWLHQANRGMNELISQRVLGRQPSDEEAPIILDTYANTSSAGSIIAFHKYKKDLSAGDIGVICSFGAGYSVGSVIVRRKG